jgi:hypothetical protein
MPYDKLYADVSSYIDSVILAPGPTITTDRSVQQPRDDGSSDGFVRVELEKTGVSSRLSKTDIDALRKRIEAIVLVHDEPLKAPRLASDDNAFLTILQTIGAAIAKLFDSLIGTIKGIPSDISKTAQLFLDPDFRKEDIGSYTRCILVLVALPYGLILRYVVTSDGVEDKEWQV